MIFVGHGIIQGSNIVLSEPLSLPEGAEVVVQIEPVVASPQTENPVALEEFLRQPCFGMWKNRAEMADSEDWVRKERERWNHRFINED